nr:MAG TPA: Vms1-associating treble clef domain protein [Caudoviricetes sp.]
MDKSYELYYNNIQIRYKKIGGIIIMVNKCVVCGKDFEAIKSTKKYCSNDCMNAARRARYGERQI